MTVCLTKCEPKDETDNKSNAGTRCDSSSLNRIGAKCKDGSSSTSIGSGACSHHGGVNYWLCK